MRSRPHGGQDRRQGKDGLHPPKDDRLKRIQIFTVMVLCSPDSPLRPLPFTVFGGFPPQFPELGIPPLAARPSAARMSAGWNLLCWCISHIEAFSKMMRLDLSTSVTQSENATLVKRSHQQYYMMLIAVRINIKLQAV